MTWGQAIEFVFDEAILPGRNRDEQAQWATYLLSIMRRWTARSVS